MRIWNYVKEFLLFSWIVDLLFGDGRSQYPHTDTYTDKHGFDDSCSSSNYLNDGMYNGSRYNQSVNDFLDEQDEYDMLDNMF